MAQPAQSTHETYNSEDADVVIRSADGIIFRLHKTILKHASPIFKDTFSIPCPGAADDGEERIDDLPVVPITESSVTFQTLLRFVYPGVRQFDPLPMEHLPHLIKAASKYEMFDVVEHLGGILIASIQSTPLHAFAIACHLDLPETARAAARQCVHAKLWPPSPNMPKELRLLSTSTLYRLLYYYEQCCQTAVAIATDTAGILIAIPPPEGIITQVNSWGEVNTKPRVWAWIECNDCSRDGAVPRVKPRKSKSVRQPQSTQSTTLWWAEYMERAVDVLAITPSGSVVQTSEILGPAFQSAGGCGICGPRVYEDLSDFSRRLGVKIDEAIDKVRYTYLPPCSLRLTLCFLQIEFRLDDIM